MLGFNLVAGVFPKVEWSTAFTGREMALSRAGFHKLPKQDSDKV
jgi:hypothetical protein